MSLRFPPVLPAAALLLLLSACRDREIRTYRAPKDPAPPAQAQAPAPGAAASTSSAEQPSLTWEKPAAWQEKPASSMRLASFAVPGTHGHEADISVTAFPGDVGGDLANINRWRGQIQLPPIAESDLASAIAVLDLPAGRFQLVDLLSENDALEGHHKARILGAWLKQPDRVWFFKMVGDDTTVAAQKDAFIEFLKTVRAR